MTPRLEVPDPRARWKLVRGPVTSGGRAVQASFRGRGDGRRGGLGSTLLAAILITVVLGGMVVPTTAIPPMGPGKLVTGINPTTVTNRSNEFDAGYVVQANHVAITKVVANWTVPSLGGCHPGRSASIRFWIGLGGYHGSGRSNLTANPFNSSGQFIGLTYSSVYFGISGNCLTHFGAFYQLGGTSGSLGLQYRSNDRITASIQYDLSTGNVTGTISDHSLARSVTHTSNVGNQRFVSAQWGVSDGGTFVGPPGGLAPFSTFSFHGCTATAGGVTRGIGSFGSVTKLTLVDGTKGTPVDVRTSSLILHINGFKLVWKSP